ncbi:hypothetical protein IP90_01449 [Luteimonas cucumeris]|uniref:Uncharacterized protein n=1 Tax=Luteimonas cucumeris TaxID=985012 RepID=A0A562L7S2_9GAMM|nr:DUF6587 family protein [Luteimonas cucumeris]TWI03635.1 hypothetical protein IP90_01449 [Luteimonas cucumeris]
MSLTLQYVVIAIAVLASVVVVARKQFPQATRRLRIACALPLLREGRPPWLRSFGRWIAPPPSQAGADACGGCNSCDTSSKPG